MNEAGDQSAHIERLRRRLAREKSARLQAEAIAERVASDRWELRQQLEEKLALRTAELEAARQAASAAVSDRQRSLASVSHEIRTSLAALFFLTESLSPQEPITAEQLTRLRSVLDDMEKSMDAAANASATGQETDSPLPLADIVSTYEASWLQAAARAGKLLILDVATPSALLANPVEVNNTVLSTISGRSVTAAPVVELRLVAGEDGFSVT
ncbi:HAMP domain-containing histidine kinase [Mycolicibacterium iranicum]|uniref:histidine kinase n=1 Tax=Mycolicibacterium iranicum TaxID=912594 RepID=A0A178LPR8_MYCIR|nr:HAMP domain-containing histidine kinase [Mycolicibacterium iranicum]OAN34469.1 hypothetical protein A4X20_07140 [Mycolicibacterium iranicum]